MEFTDKELHTICNALNDSNRHFLDMNKSFMSKQHYLRITDYITDNNNLKRRIVKYIKGDDEE